MDKNFQIAILKEVAQTYPSHALSKWDTLLKMAPGESDDQKWDNLVAHLTALEEFGYIKDFGHLSVDGKFSINQAFRITSQGLLEASEDILHPDPYKALRDALLEQAATLRMLTEKDRKTLRDVLAALPRVALERLRDKGLDSLLALLF